MFDSHAALRHILREFTLDMKQQFESLWAEREPTWTTCLPSDSRSNTSIRAASGSEQWPWKSTQQTQKDAVIMLIRTDLYCVFIINRLKRVSRLKRWFSQICWSLLWPRPSFPKCMNVFLLKLHAHFFTMTMPTWRCVTSKISGVHKRSPPPHGPIVGKCAKVPSWLAKHTKLPSRLVKTW